MYTNIIPVLLITSPLLSAILVFIQKKQRENSAILIGLWTNIFILATAILAIHSTLNNNITLTNNEFYILSKYFFFSPFSIILIFITSIIFSISLLIAIKDISSSKKKTFVELVLTLESLCLILFSTSDIAIFYCCFEAILIPIFLLININTNDFFTASKFTVLLFIGSIFLLIAIVTTVAISGETNILLISHSYFSFPQKIFLFICFFIGFGFKMAIFPFHIWLPDAHSKSPTSLSIILSGVFLKIGIYGFLFILYKLLKDCFAIFSEYIYIINLIGIAICSYSAYIQKELKRTIAYISIIHMNIISIGIFSDSQIGLIGAMLLTISHSFTSTGLFIINHIYKISSYLDLNTSDICNKYKLFKIISSIIMLANISLPGLSNFIGEFFILLALASQSILYCSILLLSTFSTIFFIFKKYIDIFCRRKTTYINLIYFRSEIYLLEILSIFIIYLGLFPRHIFVIAEKTYRYYL